MRLMDGSVWTFVDLEDRIKVKYVPWYSRVVLGLEVPKRKCAHLQNAVHYRFIRHRCKFSYRKEGSYADTILSA